MLNKKTLFITGGSRGIGLAIALRAAKDGANIAIAAKTGDAHPKLPGTIHTAAAEIEQAGGKALPIVCDIRFEDQVRAAVEQTAEEFGGIDICINNASAISLTPTVQTDMKRYDLMHQINAPRHFPHFETLHPASAEGGKPAHPDAVAAARHESEVVRAARRLYDRQVRHEPLRVGHGSRAQGARHRGQRALAAHRHRHGRDRNVLGRRQAHARWPHAGHHRRRRPSSSSPSRRANSPATSASTTRCSGRTASAISTSTVSTRATI